MIHLQVRALVVRLAAAVLLAGSAGTASATAVNYSIANLVGNTWAYSYTITSDRPTGGLPSYSIIQEISIYFDRTRYADLAVASSPMGWDSIVIQPDPGLPDDGFVDVLALADGLAPGGTLSGLSVTFTYLGTGTPGSQPFDVVEPPAHTNESGVTTVVPLPSGLWLLGTGLVPLLARARRRARVA
ncbi:MAG: hypothetical protein ABI567_08770 [Gammaproteobacteria bacterium]